MNSSVIIFLEELMPYFSTLAIILVLILLYFEYRRVLMMLQQNSYRNQRYRRWLKTSQDSTSIMRLLTGASALASLSTFANPYIVPVLVCIVALIDILILSKKKYKKPLVMTKRAMRIFATMWIISIIVLAGVSLICFYTDVSINLIAIAALLLYCFSHFTVQFANILLQPVEKRINKTYYNDAERILESMPDLKIIGITGSYGKTSTKHYLQRILSEKYDVMMTPGSFNTTMGVIRTIREYLKPYNEVFIVEMGAKQPGDIKEICDLVHPEIGIVTAVGEQHLESFKTLENVRRTKFELIDALPHSGLAIINNDFPAIESSEVSGKECIRYAVSSTGEAAYTAKNILYTPRGTSFEVVTPRGECLAFTTRLVGECNVSNLLAAIIVALRMDVPIEKIRYSVANIEQVEHRLNMKRTPAGVTIIDDAFNSNPTGSAMALDVLEMMKGGQRIIVTPGMIELGEKQAELNEAFGKKIAHCADIAIIVGLYNREAIVEGIKSQDAPNLQLHTADSFNDAQQLLAKIVRPGDTILYENDLPDTFK